MFREPAVRRATRFDMPAVAQLAASLVRFHHQLDPRRFLCLEPLEPGYERWLTHELDNPKAVVLVAETPPHPHAPAHAHKPPAILGYAYGRMEPRDWNALLDTAGVLHDLYVADNARTQGVGAALVNTIARELKTLGAPHIILHTATQNAAAQRLFEKLGFRRTMVEMTRETE